MSCNKRVAESKEVCKENGSATFSFNGVTIPPSFTEWDGRVFEFGGEFEAYLTPSSPRVALRNKRLVKSPIYRCKASGETVIRADIVIK